MWWGFGANRPVAVCAAVAIGIVAADDSARAQGRLAQLFQSPSSFDLPPTPPMPIPNVPPASSPVVPPGGAPPLALQAPPATPFGPPPSSLPPTQALPAPAALPQRPTEGALSAQARFGASAPVITGGLHWRVYADRPDPSGVLRLVKEDKAAQPTFVLPPGNYVVHVAFGLASAVKPVSVRAEPMRETFDIAAGGLVLKGQVGDVRIPNQQISFDVYQGSQFEPGEKRPIVSNVVTGDVVLVPEGTYYILSKYGDGNAVVRSDIRVTPGKLADITVTHRAAAIMLKLVGRRGGEALANTDWVVLSPAGDTITESKGAFPRVILAEGEYRVIARNESKTFQQDFRVVPGVDSEVEVLAR